MMTMILGQSRREGCNRCTTSRNINQWATTSVTPPGGPLRPLGPYSALSHRSWPRPLWISPHSACLWAPTGQFVGPEEEVGRSRVAYVVACAFAFPATIAALWKVRTLRGLYGGL
jgi:hypothetical protein